MVAGIHYINHFSCILIGKYGGYSDETVAIVTTSNNVMKKIMMVSNDLETINVLCILYQKEVIVVVEETINIVKYFKTSKTKIVGVQLHSFSVWSCTPIHWLQQVNNFFKAGFGCRYFQPLAAMFTKKR